MEVNPLITTEYHLQTNEQVKRFNATIVSRLCHHVAEQQQNLDSYAVSLTYAYNTQVNRTTKLPPFRFVVCRQPPAPATRTVSPMPPDVEQVDSAIALLSRLIRRAVELKRMADKNLRQAQRRYKWDRDKKDRVGQAF